VLLSSFALGSLGTAAITGVLALCLRYERAGEWERGLVKMTVALASLGAALVLTAVIGHG